MINFNYNYDDFKKEQLEASVNPDLFNLESIVFKSDVDFLNEYKFRIKLVDFNTIYTDLYQTFYRSNIFQESEDYDRKLKIYKTKYTLQKDLNEKEVPKYKFSSKLIRYNILDIYNYLNLEYFANDLLINYFINDKYNFNKLTLSEFSNITSIKISTLKSFIKHNVIIPDIKIDNSVYFDYINQLKTFIIH